MTALPTVEQLTFLLAMRLNTVNRTGGTEAMVSIGGYEVWVERSGTSTGYEAFAMLPPGDADSDWGLNSYCLGTWLDGDTYPSLNAAAAATLAAIREHQSVRRQ